MGQCWSRNRQHPPMMGAQKLHKQPDGTERTTTQEEEEGVAAAAAVAAATEEAEMSTSHLEWLTSPTGTAATADSPLFVEKSSSDKRGNHNSRNNDDTSPFADLGAQHQATTETTTANKKTTTFNRGRSSSRANLRSHRRRRQRRAATLRPSSPSRSPSPPHNNNSSSCSSNFTPLVNNSKQLQSSVIVEEKDPEAPSDEEDFHIEHHVAQKLDRTGRLFANAADLQQLLKLQRPRPTAASINTITTTTMSTTAAPTTNKSTATDGTDAATTAAAAATTTTAVSLEPTGRQAVHPAAYSHFQKIKLQVAVAEHEQTRISNCTTIEERFQDVTEQRQLWKEYQEIQQAVGLAQSLPDTTASPRSIGDDDEDDDEDDDDGGDDDDSQTQQEKKKTKKRSLRQFWRRRREKRRAAQQEEQMMNRNNTSQNSSFLFDFSDMPPQDDMVVDIDPLADYTSDGEESSQASLSLLSETSMEQQRRLFAEKARLRSIPMPQIDVMSATTTTEVEEQGAENNNNSSGVEQSEKESTAAAAAIEETTAPPTDYGPTHMPPPRRQSDYGPSPTERETRNNNKKQNNVADLCSLTSGGFETMSGVEVLVNHNRRSQNGSGTAAAADEASLVSDLGDDYSVARSLASFRRYQRVNDYGGARNLRSDSAHDQIDPRFAEKLCETKLSDRLDKLEQALQKQKKENIDNEEEPGILTPTKTPVKSNVNSKPSFDKQCISDEALETPALAVGLDHAVVTPETEQAEQMAMTPQVVLDAVLKQRKALESLQAEQEKSSVTPEKEKLPQVVSPAILESSGGVSTFKSSAPDISKDMSKENAKVVKPDPSGIKNFDDEQAPKLKGSSRYQTQQVTDRQSVITKYRTGRSRQSKPVFRSSVQNVDRVLSHLLHTNSDSSDRKEESFSKDLAATASKPPQSLAPSSQSFRVVGLAPPAHPRKKKAESKVPVIGMSTDEFLKYGEELGFPEDEVPGNQTPQSLASKTEKGSGELDRTEHQRSRESFAGGNLPPIPCESFDEGNQISEDVLKGYSNENATTQIPMVLKISNEDTDPVPIPLNPETTNRLSLAELRGARSDLDTAQNSLLLAEKVEAQVKDVLKKYRSYDSE